MTSSDKLIEAIKGFEGLRLTAYKCPGGEWTIGYGSTSGVHEGMTITEDEAEERLRQDLTTAEAYVNKKSIAKTQGEFDALVDFCYNLGTAALGRSTLLKKIRNGSPTYEILKEFRRWVYADGKKLEGLVRRREWECQRYVSHD